jgi:tRNA threonylcarbamoyladenosine biosynthesis protein TsaB
MYILHIETSVKTCSVALSNQGNLLAVKESHPEGFEHSESLNLFILEVLSSNNLNLKNLSAIAISAGPGSYTGLRIGAATAKGLCYALDIPLIAMDALSIMMDKFWKEQNTVIGDYFIPMIDARRMEVYQSIFKKDKSIFEKPSANIIEEKSFNHLKGKIVIFGEGADKLTKVNFESEVIIIPNFKTSASGMIEMAYAKFIKNEFEDVAYFDPIYLKEFQAG